MPMDIILRGVPLEPSILAAIKTRSGHLGAMLAKIEEDEKNELKEVMDNNFDKLKTGDILFMLRKNGVNIPNI